jgi:NitT/TauT family transport system substrate-binding protein
MAAASAMVLAACGSTSTPAAPASSAVASTPGVSPSASASGPAAKPAASGSQAAASVTPSKLVVSYSAIVPMTLPVWVASDEGIFKKNGLDVQLTYIESSKGIAAVISGETQMANIGGPETLSAVAGGADLVTVACESPSWPFVMQVVPGINSMAELKGKKVGVSNFGSTSDIATRLALENSKLDPEKDVAIIAVGSASNRLAALKSGAIQGGVSFPPRFLHAGGPGLQYGL